MNDLIVLLNEIKLDNEYRQDSILKYNVISLDSQEAYNTYKIRSKLHQKDQELSVQFKELFSVLRNKNEDIKIHSFILEGKVAYVFFTDFNLNEVYGKLRFAK